MKCIHCNTPLKNVFVDLNYSPISNDMLNSKQLNLRENYYPLKVYVCDSCFLVQHDEYKKASEIFDDKYTYFSSFSSTWLKHLKEYVDMMMDRFSFNTDSLVIEIASNDGCLLENFVKNKIPVLGIEPTANTAIEAEKRGVRTIKEFFGTEFVNTKLKPEGLVGDLIIGNNVLAHVPNINDFVMGMKLALKEGGIITMEFPHLLNLIKESQFDTIYHEHFTYLSLNTVYEIFKEAGLEIFDCEKLVTHGGSLRIYAKHAGYKNHERTTRFSEIYDEEIKEGVKNIDYYLGFQEKVYDIKYDALLFLINEKRKGKNIIGYGAASKGNTFLNYCGIHGTDLINYVVDASPHKQNKYLPGSHIPVVNEDIIKETKPDYIIILPWNIKEEISEQLDYIRGWGGKFVTFIPEINVF